jgi:lipid A 3-O-deacylase
MKPIVAAIGVLCAFSVNAQHVDVRIGSNSQGISVTSSPLLQAGRLSLAWEAGVQRWEVNNAVGTQLYITPAFRWSYTSAWSVDAGVGVSVIDRIQFGDKTISTHFQFADHIGVAYSSKGHAVGLRYVHVSNAGIKEPNPGLDSVQVTGSFKF